MTAPQFRADRKTIDAVAHNLEVIGEAVKRLPPSAKDRRTDVDWRKIAGLRDILIHACFGIDLAVVSEPIAPSRF